MLQTTASFCPPVAPEPPWPISLCTALAMMPKKGSAMSLTRTPTRSEVDAASALAGPLTTYCNSSTARSTRVRVAPATG